MTRMHEDARTVIVKGTIEFFARVMLDPVTEQARIEDVYTDERVDWDSMSLIDGDDDQPIDDTVLVQMTNAWAFDDPVRIEFDWSRGTDDLSARGPFKAECDHRHVSYVDREGWYVCDDCGEENVDLPDDDEPDDERRERNETLRLAMENNPDLAFTASDMEDH